MEAKVAESVVLLDMKGGISFATKACAKAVARRRGWAVAHATTHHYVHHLCMA